jgi:hypothetical protein
MSASGDCEPPEGWTIENIRDRGQRVTRQMVEGDTPIICANGRYFGACALCGAALLVSGAPDFVEIHRAWHDGLLAVLALQGGS